MDRVDKALNILTEASKNNRVINFCLAGAFAALCVKSMIQEKGILALQVEKNSLTQSNKTMKKTMWEWKQQLFADAATEPALLPLAKIKAIYGEASTPQTGVGADVKDGAKSTTKEFVI